MTSLFPNALDNLSNLPTVRNLATDLSAAQLNNLRDAILAIEKALGVGINGSYIDLATRLSQFIAVDGSLKKAAFQAIGGIFGPLTDSDVDQNAQISESKLKLSYPTAVLQNQIAVLDARNAGLVDLILNTKSALQQHITIGVGAHAASAIVITKQSTPIGSATSTAKIESSSVQGVVEDIYNKHINFGKGTSVVLTGGLSVTNNSHTAEQIFYDNTESQLVSSSVQGAIDSIVTSGNSSINDHQRLLHSNGVLRRIERIDARNSSSIQRGRLLLSGVGTDTNGVPGSLDAPGSATSNGTSILITIPMTTQPDGTLKNGVPLSFTHNDGTIENISINTGDDVLLVDPSTQKIIGVVPITALKIFQVSQNTPLDGYNVAGNLTGVEVFYDPAVFTNPLLFNSGAVSGARSINFYIFQQIDANGNKNGLNLIARSLSSANEADITAALNEIQVAHPDAATVISQGFNASALARRSDGYFDRNSTNTLTFVVDDTFTYNIVIVPSAPIDITLDTVIAKANLEFYQNNVNITAFRIGKEIAFAHNWPDDTVIAGADHTIRIISGAANDASTAAGLSFVANQTVTSSSGNAFVVNGQKQSSLNVKLSLAQAGWSFSAPGANTGSVSTIYFSSINPLLLGVRVGDIVNLQGLSTSGINQDGIRTIQAVTDTSLSVNGNSFNTDLSVGTNSTLVIYSNGLLLNNLRTRLQSDYPALITNSDDPTQNIITNIFVNSSAEIDYREKLIYSGKATLFVPSGGFSGGGGTPPTNLDLITGAIIPGSNGSGIYIVDASRGLQGAATGLRKIISFLFDIQGRVFATYGCPDSTGSFNLSQSLHGAPVNITGDGVYTLIDETGLEFITIQTVKAFQLVPANVFPGAITTLTYSMAIYQFEQINEYENLLLASLYYNATTNRVPILNGDLAIFDRRYSGTMGAEQLRDDVVEELFQAPFNETRGNGVVNGLSVPSDPTGSLQVVTDRTVYVNGGVAYISGIRYEIPTQNLYVDPATLDLSQYGGNGFYPGTADQLGHITYYVILDQNGRLQTTNKLLLASSTPYIPIAKIDVATAGVGLNQVPIIRSVTAMDFRLFIDGIDDKIEITVSPLPQQPAHFHSIAAALEYVDAMRYNDAANSGLNLHTRPMIIRLMDGVYQELTTLNIPPYITIKGENSRSVRIRPPKLLPGIVDISGIDTTSFNKYIFNVNLLPDGQSNTIESICFDCNCSGPFTGIDAYGNTTNRTFAGAININWFSNTTAANSLSPTITPNVPYNTNIANAASLIAIKECLFILDGPQETKGITTTFGVAIPTIMGGIFRYSNYYSSIFTGVYLSYYGNYFNHIDAPTGILPLFPIHNTPSIPSPTPSVPAPPANTSGTPLPPISESTAVFDGDYDHGGITTIQGNSFVLSDNTDICVDRFYDTSGNGLPVSNARVRGFSVLNNNFRYTGTILTNTTTYPQNVSTMGISPTPNPGVGTSLREVVNNKMVHRDLRGYVPIDYTNPDGYIYPDPVYSGQGLTPNGIPIGFAIPAAGGRVNEYITISGNTPSGLNSTTEAPIRFATDSMDSPARDNHGGGTIFATIKVPADGTPVIVDRSTDWHDRYIYCYMNNSLGQTGVRRNQGGSVNPLYDAVIQVSNPDPNPQKARSISSSFGVSFNQDSTSLNGSVSSFDNSVSKQSMTMTFDGYGNGIKDNYEFNTKCNHGYIYGYVPRLTGATINVIEPTSVNIADWNKIQYLGAVNMFLDDDNVLVNSMTMALAIMPNGALALSNTGYKDQSNFTPNASLGTMPIITADQIPGGATPTPGFSNDPSRNGNVSGATIATQTMVISLVINYSPRVNLFKTYADSINKDNYQQG